MIIPQGSTKEHTPQDYFNSNLTIEDSKVYCNEFSAMIDHEQWNLAYKTSADKICDNGGKILQIGFGLGNMSHYIHNHDIEVLDIIEPHPELQSHAESLGYSENLLKGTWLDWIEKMYDSGIKYDGIYFLDSIPILDKITSYTSFLTFIDGILKPGGVLSCSMGYSTLQITSRWNLDLLGYKPEIKVLTMQECFDYNVNGETDPRIKSPESHYYYINWYTKPELD